MLNRFLAAALTLTIVPVILSVLFVFVPINLYFLILDRLEKK